MTVVSRLIINVLLPLLLLSGGYLLLYGLGQGIISEAPLQTLSIGLSALIAALPPLAFRLIVRNQIKRGFALLKSGKVVLPNEITLFDVLGDRITAWKLFQQHLNTEACLQGEGMMIYVQLGLDFYIPANERGKQFIKHYKTNMTIFEAWVQRAIFLASLQDRELVHILPDEVLLNEDDEQVLRSKFLSALEDQPLESLILPIDTSAITVNRQVRTIPIIRNDSNQPIEENLDLDQKLLHELGLESTS